MTASCWSKIAFALQTLRCKFLEIVQVIRDAVAEREDPDYCQPSQSVLQADKSDRCMWGFVAPEFWFPNLKYQQVTKE